MGGATVAVASAAAAPPTRSAVRREMAGWAPDSAVSGAAGSFIDLSSLETRQQGMMVAAPPSSSPPPASTPALARPALPPSPEAGPRQSHAAGPRFGGGRS